MRERTASRTVTDSLAILAWMGVIFTLSAQHRLPRPPGLGPDFVAIAGHLTVYAVLAWLLDRSALLSRFTPRQRFLIALLGAVLYGVSDEVHQSFVPGRTPDVVDLAIDTVGALCALSVVRVMDGRR